MTTRGLGAHPRLFEPEIEPEVSKDQFSHLMNTSNREAEQLDVLSADCPENVMNGHREVEGLGASQA